MDEGQLTIVADEICITSPHQHADTTLDDTGEGREEGPRVVSGIGELGARGIAAFLVGRLGANGLRDRRRGQIRGVRLWRIRIVAWGPDVVDVEIALVDDGVLDVLSADLVRVLARGVVARRRGALLQGRRALGRVRIQEAGVLRRGEDLVVGVVEGVVDVGAHDDRGVEVAVVDAERDEWDIDALDRAGGDGSVLRLEVGCKLGPKKK